MKYKGDIGLYLSGAPVPLPQCAIYITQPTIKQIVQFGETNFLMAVQLLTKTETYLDEIRQGNSELSNKSNFQILMTMIMNEEQIKDYFNTFFELICPDYDVEYTPNSINFRLKNSENPELVNGMVTLFTFETFQETINELFVSESEDNSYNPANDAAAEIARKLEKARKQKAREEGSDVVFMFGSFASILAIGLQMDINVFYNYTPFQIYDAYSRYWEKQKYDFYQKIRTTPLMDTSKMEEPKEWTRNLYDIDYDSGNN